MSADAGGVFVRWFSFDLVPPFENGLTASEVDVSRREVVQALVVSTVVVVLDERRMDRYRSTAVADAEP